MKLALVNPYRDRGDPPLGLAYIAAYLRQRGGFSDTVIIDQGDPLRAIRRQRPDLVGISALSCTFPEANRLAGAIKAELGVPVIVGGYHITAMPHHLKDSHFDVGVLGEGEQTAAELVQLYERKGALAVEDLRKIKGLVFRNERNENEMTEKRPLIADLDTIPLPARDLLQMKGAYLTPRKAAFAKLGFYLGITTSRGCPYECAFCSPRGFWNTFRSFSPQRVVDEISLLVDQYKVDGIMIWDDLFAVNKKRMRQIVELLEQRGITRKIEFAVFARANLIDEEIVSLLQRMRVTSVIFGLESGSERILNYLKKGTVTVEQNYRALRLCKEHGMRIRATLIIGSPDETREDLKQTAKLFKSPDIDEPIICHLTPLPGTQVWAQARDLGLVRDDIDWDYASLTGWDFDPRLIMTAHVSPEELRQSYDDLAQWGEKRLQEDNRGAIRLKYLFNWRLLGKVAKLAEVREIVAREDQVVTPPRNTTSAGIPSSSSPAHPPDGSVLWGNLFEQRRGATQHRCRRHLARALPWCIWLYVAAVALVWLLLRMGGDRWWFPTLILFGPRWLCAVPLVVLTPLAGLLHRRMLWPLSAAALIVFGPIMGFCVPWARLTASDRPTIRVLTCNVKGRCKANEVLNELIRNAAPDIVALQGCWHQARVKWPEGWHARQYGDLLIASHYPLQEFRSLDKSKSPRINLLSCVVVTPDRQVTLSTLHPQSPHRSFDQMFDHRTILRPSESSHLTQEIEQRWQDSEEAAKWLEECGDLEIIAGDLNLPPDSTIYRRFWAGYQNAFSSAGLGFGYTEWPKMRKMRFGIRIDHILTAGSWRPRRCWVGPDIGSDHLPLIADLVWVPSGDEL